MQTNLFRVGILYLLFLPTFINAQTTLSPEASAMGGCSILAEDHWALLQNPAGLTFSREKVFAFSQMRGFMLKELDHQTVQFSIPVFKTAATGFAYTKFGYSLFMEQDFIFVWSQRFGEKISGGMQFRYHTLKLGEAYGTNAAFLFRLGMLAKITSALTVATQLENPAVEGISDYNEERLPVYFSLGCGYKFSKQLKLFLEAKQELKKESVFCGGLEYFPIPSFSIRVGISSDPLQGSFGFGWRYKLIEISVAAAHHPYLGFSPQIGLSIFFSKKSEK